MSATAAQSAEVMKQSPLTKLYPEADWKALFTKLGEMEAQDYDWSDRVAAIKSPTMLVFADADATRPKHIVEFYKSLGGGQPEGGLDGSLRPTARLAIVPGTAHYNLFATTTVAELVADFLGSFAPRPR